MVKLKFTTQINAPKEKVWDVLWNDDTYPQWTAAFTPGSHAVSDWQEGDEIQFLDGNGDGMYGHIVTKIPNAQMTFQHKGEIQKGKEVPKDWGEALETYYLTEDKGITTLRVETDMMDEYVDMMNEMFPKALQLVKEIVE